jgi:hypothetical protein
MNRIVREHYPVSKLPEDLREGLPGEGKVTITAGSSTGEGPARSEPPRPLSYYRQFARSHFATIEEAVQHVRALRDEWDRR